MTWHSIDQPDTLPTTQPPLQGFAVNDFRGRTGWACPADIPPPCTVTGDQVGGGAGVAAAASLLLQLLGISLHQRC